MRRTAFSFILVCLISLILGIVLFLIIGHHRTMMLTSSGPDVGLWVPCFALAALFGAFACLYLTKIPMSEGPVWWHFWASVGGAAIFALIYLLISLLGDQYVASHEAHQPPQWLLLLSVVGLVVGPVMFLVGQLIFLFNLGMAIVRITRDRSGRQLT